MIGSYLNILKESLEKKLTVLDKISEVGDAQTELLKEEPVDLEHFDACVDEKDAFIEELSELDDGFESLYEKVREELMENKGQYAEQIKTLQDLISQVTDKSVSIQAQEQRNKALVEKALKAQRRDVGNARRNSQVAFGYYQNMSRPGGDAGSSFSTKK